MPKKKVLIIEDEENIQELIEYNLKKSGYDVLSVDSGEEGITWAEKYQPDLILLDIMLPGIDGLELCKILKSRAATETIPIIMVSARGEEPDVVSGLELGAEDYITKPFSPRVLLARVKAVLRRTEDEEETGETLSRDNLTIHPGRHEVYVFNKKVTLTVSEFRTLYLLATKPGWVYTRNQIVDAVRGENYPVTDRSVDVLIVSLRKKLGTCGDLIQTVRGVGYRFKDLVNEK